MRDYYKTLIVGASGKGKTYSFRNLDSEKTGFINVENKPLPFKNNFKHHKRINTPGEALAALVEFAKDDSINCIVFDSFSAYMDMVLYEARQTKKGFDVWSAYNEEIAKFHRILNKINKEVFVTAHYEILNIEGAPEKRVKVQGKENEGQVEKHYTIVLYAESKFVENQKPNYYFSLMGENTSAKCPPDIFGEDKTQIPNDVNDILTQISNFVS